MKTIFTFLFLIFFLTSISAQDIDATLSGNTSEEGFSVINKGGSTLFRVNGLGNVGIGTTTPTEKLQLGSFSEGNVFLTLKSAGGNRFQNGLKLRQFTDDGGWDIVSDERGGSNGLNFIRYFWNGTANDSASAMFLDKISGRVGIGTTNPRGIFDVATNSEIYLANDPITGTTQSIFLPGHIFIAPYNGSNVSYLQARRSDNTGSTELQIRTFNSGTLNEALRINSFGYVGIGTTSPTHSLVVENNVNDNHTAVIRSTSATGNGLAVRVQSGSSESAFDIDSQWGQIFKIESGGVVTGNYGTYHAPSDRRLKKEIITIPDALDKVMKLRGVNYKWKDSKKDQSLQMGFVAQEVEKVVPEVIHTSNDSMQTKAVEYQYLVGLLVEAVKEQQKQIESLEKKVNSIALKENEKKSFGYKDKTDKLESMNSVPR